MTEASPQVYKVGGPLDEENEEVYIERVADRDLSRYLNAMEYVMILEPRQQGKTSLVMHFYREYKNAHQVFVYVDTSTLWNSNQNDWYNTLCERIGSQIGDDLPGVDQIPLAQNGQEWRNYLANLAKYCAGENKRIIIALDEIGGAGHLSLKHRNQFFSVIREIYSCRGNEKYLKSLTFILLGACSPSDLIQDPIVSPFNVAQKIALEDFYVEQVISLVERKWTEETSQVLGKRIFYWTDGQPYLTQWLCDRLPVNAESRYDVDRTVDRLLIEDDVHLPGSVRRIADEQSMLRYIRRIQLEPIKFNPTNDRRQRKLRLLGIITGEKKTINGEESYYCKIRNRIYKRVIVQFETVVQIDKDDTDNQESLEIIDIFLASSLELKGDREKVEIFICRENKRLVSKGIFLYLNIWEDFLDAMSRTRSQDEYNKAVAESDIVFFLFATKVGKYTEEEFDIAHAEFLERGKPKHVFTYFKEVDIRVSGVNMDDLNSLVNFKKRLEDLEHYYTPYTSIEDLTGRLKDQLDRIIEA